eukprot:CAMPEP_0168759480 /NCGR_PEP_ID=MMETSP0724-20121128/22247_1 /TAXON_ID=265536 /ORGANISM="Amphiprora sp., Strain CCMP467" /LENGTH=54 /DNA_ID=CAMNT_0008808409 /DNA_START=574 /DNA_END=735 /DNA_ORIENTATION=-
MVHSHAIFSFSLIEEPSGYFFFFRTKDDSDGSEQVVCDLLARCTRAVANKQECR